MVVDNSDSSYRDTGQDTQWVTAKISSEMYGVDYRLNIAGSGLDYATWNFVLSRAGVYNVYVWYSVASNRANNAPFTVYCLGEPQTVIVNQQINGGRWVWLGAFPFEAGSVSVVLTDNAQQEKVVVADAVKITWSSELSQ